MCIQSHPHVKCGLTHLTQDNTHTYACSHTRPCTHSTHSPSFASFSLSFFHLRSIQLGAAPIWTHHNTIVLCQQSFCVALPIYLHLWLHALMFQRVLDVCGLEKDYWCCHYWWFSMDILYGFCFVLFIPIYPLISIYLLIFITIRKSRMKWDNIK